MNFLLDTIKSKAAGRGVVLPVFGDAASLAALALCVKALTPEKVYCVHIDHGMLRGNEAAKIKNFVKNLGIKNAVFASHENVFLLSTTQNEQGRIIGPLSTVCVPNEKREIIVNSLNRIYRDAVSSFNAPDLYVAGMYGIGGESLLPQIDGAVKIAREAGADEMFLRQPFPMQGFGIRTLCNKSVIALTTEQREALYAVTGEVDGSIASRLVPLRTVGIVNGERTYKSMALLSDKGVNSRFDKLFAIAGCVNEKLSFVNRVVCRIDSDEHAYPYHSCQYQLCNQGFEALRIADGIVNEEFSNTTAVQFFAVLIPLVADTDKEYSIVIRAVATDNFKTARSLFPGVDFPLSVLEKVVSRIKKELPEADMVLYDITSKPPAAIEWE